MTTTSNIVLNVPVWQTSHAYTAGKNTLVTNSGNCYVCITSGTSASSGGPTTTSNNITDGTAHWQYLGAANYTSMTSWASGIPGTLTQPVVGQVLAPAFIDITSPAFTPVLALSGHSTTPTNTITLTAFPGYGIRDTLGVIGESAPLFLNTANGITFVGPAAAANPNDYFLITDANVIFDGLMFQDLDTTSDQTSLVTTNSGAANFQLRDCIVDGTPQAGGAWMVQLGDQALCANCLFVDRAPSPVGGFAANLITGGIYANCTFYSTSGAASEAVALGTSVAITAKNCAFIGYTNPFGGPAGSTATVTNCITDGTFGGTNTTIGAGNVLSATPSTLFVSATADFRLKAGSACIGMGAVDTTDIPLANDIGGHARLASKWDAGAWEYGINAAGTSAIVLKSVGTATVASAFSAHATVSLPPLKAVVTLAKALSARVSIALLSASAMAFSGQSNPAACAAFLGERPESGDFSSDFGPYTFFYVLANAIVTLNASASVNLPTLAAVGFLNDVAAGSSAIPAIACVAAATAIGAANIVGLGSVNVTAVANMSSLTTATGSAAIIIQPLMSARQTDNGSATVSFGAMHTTGLVAQFNQAAATVSVSTIAAAGVIGFSGSATVNLPALAIVASATLAGQAVGLATLPPLQTPDAVRPELQADPSAGVFLLADGSSLILRADVPRARTLSESTNMSGTATIPPLACVGVAFESDVATLARNIANMAAVASLGMADLATGSASVVLAVSSQAAQQRSSGTLATLASLQAVVAAGQSDVATGTGALALAAVGAAQQVDQAHSAANVNLAVVANGGPTLIWSGTVSLPPMAAVITMANVNGIHGSASIVLAVAGALTSSTNASAADAVATMAVAASAMLTTPATAAVSIPSLMAVAALGQSDAATGSSAVVLRCAAVLNNASVSAATLATVPPLVAAGTAQNFILSASTMASIRLGVAATASISGAQMAGSGTITISAASATGQANFAATLASLAVLAETNATLYVSPTEYETGDQVIYWPA